VADDVVALVRESGPRTGSEILASVGGDAFTRWRECGNSPELLVRLVGRRYVRLDRRVEGYARLSPSIQREFLTYSVVGLAAEPAAVDSRVRQIEGHIADVSRRKLELAASIMSDVVGPLVAEDDATSYCVLVAGDIVYGMAHEVDRPERSTGAMVNGSDLDIVVIVRDDAPEALLDQLDGAIHKKKYQYLNSPVFREEIDYVVKRFSTVREQARFDTFKRMVACKILDEAVLLQGSPDLFEAAKALLAERGVVDELRELERLAIEAREDRERYLLKSDLAELRGDDLLLFQTDEESEEFE
jgi:hypothetical protein